VPKILKMEQGSTEWHEARRGVITATKAQALLATTKKGDFTAARETAICELAMERLGGTGRDPIVGGATLERGHTHEDDAAIAYEFSTGRKLETCGFMIHSRYPQYGCSPDRLVVGEPGMVEIKVPTCIKKMTNYLLSGEHADEYYFQLLHQMYVAERDWVDIIAYDNRAPSFLQTAILRVERPDTWGPFEASLFKADREVSRLMRKFKALKK